MELAEIRSADWQLSLTTPGDVVQGIADIQQCVHIILSTQKGSDPLRPEFGTDILRYLDRPVNEAVPNMIREMMDAVNTWETRVKITKIEHEIDKTNPGKITFKITWKTALAEGQNVIIYG
jgi:phage baseplate assembly protein W